MYSLKRKMPHEESFMGMNCCNRNLVICKTFPRYLVSDLSQHSIPATFKFFEKSFPLFVSIKYDNGHFFALSMSHFCLHFWYFFRVVVKNWKIFVQVSAFLDGLFFFLQVVCNFKFPQNFDFWIFVTFEFLF